jgi:TM2 domain-containing membrane protein YozV
MSKSFKYLKLIIFILLSNFLNFTFETNGKENPWKSRPCSQLSLGQYTCSQPQVNLEYQTEEGCMPSRLVNVSCYPTSGVICENRTFDGKTMAFRKEIACRYVTQYRYQTAVLLSIFLGIFGVDRFYLGYMAFGLLKMCTFGFMLIGYIIDMVLIITQTLSPSDASDYIVDYYGQVFYPSIPFNNNTYQIDFN